MQDIQYCAPANQIRLISRRALQLGNVFRISSISKTYVWKHLLTRLLLSSKDMRFCTMLGDVKDADSVGTAVDRGCVDNCMFGSLADLCWHSCCQDTPSWENWVVECVFQWKRGQQVCQHVTSANKCKVPLVHSPRMKTSIWCTSIFRLCLQRDK